MAQVETKADAPVEESALAKAVDKAVTAANLAAKREMTTVKKTHTEEVKRLKTENENLRSNVTSITKELNSKSTALANLKKVKEKLEAKIVELQAQLPQLGGVLSIASAGTMIPFASPTAGKRRGPGRPAGQGYGSASASTSPSSVFDPSPNNKDAFKAIEQSAELMGFAALSQHKLNTFVAALSTPKDDKAATPKAESKAIEENAKLADTIKTLQQSVLDGQVNNVAYAL